MIKYVLLTVMLIQFTLTLLITQIKAGNTLLSAVTYYEITFIRYGNTSSVPANSKILVKFPQQYLSIIQLDGCTLIGLNVIDATCSFNGQYLVVEGAFPSAASNINDFGVKLTGVKNPSPAKTYQPFIGIIQTPTGEQQIDTLEQGSIIITPGTATCSTTGINNYINTNGNIQVVYTSSYVNSSNSANCRIRLIQNSTYSQDPDTPITVTVSGVDLDPNAFPLEFTFTSDFNISLKMPPSTQPATNFITLQNFINDGTNNLLDSCQITIDNVSTADFNALNMTQAQVQALTNITVSMDLTTPLFIGDTILMQFLNQTVNPFGLQGVASSVQFTAGSSGYKPISGQSTSILTVSDITLFRLPQTTPLFSFIIENITAPFSSKAHYIKFTMKTKNGYQRNSRILAYIAKTGSLTSNIVCDSIQIGRNTNCTFNITSKNSILNNGTLQVIIPVGFTISLTDSNTICQSQGSGINFQSACKYNTSARLLTISSFFSGTSNAKLSSYLVDVPVIIPKTISQYTISLNTQSYGSPVDIGTYLLQPSSRLISPSQLIITVNTNVTLTSTTYKLDFSNLQAFTWGQSYNISIYFPFQLVDESATANGISVNSKSLQTSYNLNTNILTIFNCSISILEIAGFFTFKSTRQISIYGNFSIGSINYLYWLGSGIKMSVPRLMKSYNLIQSSQIVNTVFNATLQLSDLEINDTIFFQSGYYIPQSCTINVINCYGNNTIQILSINNIGQQLTQFIILMLSPSSTRTISANLTVYDNTTQYAKQYRTYSYQATIPNKMLVNYTQNQPYYNETSNYTFLVELSTANATALQVTIPSSFKIMSASCSQPCGANPTMSGNKIVFILNNQMSARLFIQMINPFNFNTNLQFLSKSNQGEKDYNGSISIAKICSDPCRSCLATNSTFCLSCYSWDYNILRNDTCVSNCNPSEFETTDSFNMSICSPCQSQCLSCIYNASNCLSCQSNYYLLNNTCYNICPNGYYASSTLCQPCMTNCLKCSSASICTNCTNFLDNTGKCVSTCPSGFFGSNNLCKNCVNNCSNCTNSSNCFECVPNTLLYINSSCLSSCPNGFFASNINCTKCTNNCSTCSSQTICLTCISNFKLLPNNTCSTSCETGYYASTTNVCISCSTFHSDCTSCNQTGCLICSAPYYLQFQNCVQSCTTLHKSNTGSLICEACRSPCKTCTISDYCTGCISGYALLAPGTCSQTCYQGYYKSNADICQTCPINCTSCQLFGNQVRCTACQTENLFYGYECVFACPVDTSEVSPYCISKSCASISNCLTCSNLRCLVCSSGFTLIQSGSCEDSQSGKTISTVSQIPIPFPFFIGIIIIIIAGCLIKMHFTKMYVPVFIYAASGIMQAGCLALWASLAFTKQQNLQVPILIVPIGLLGLYILFNIVGLVLFFVWVCPDRKFTIWLKQGNYCPSITIIIISVIVSFRFLSLHFSRLAEREIFSAVITTPRPYYQAHIIGIASLFLINIPIIVFAGYIAYLQIELSFLFFSCLQTAAVGIIMIIINILHLLAPHDYTLVKKSEYQQGFDQEQGKSIEQMMAEVNVMQQQYREGQEIKSDEPNFQLRQAGQQSSNALSVVGQTFIYIQQQEKKLDFDDNEHNTLKKLEKSRIFKENNRLTQIAKQMAKQQEQNQRKQAMLLAKTFMVQVPFQPSKPIGSIIKQILPEYKQDDILSSQSEQLQLDQPTIQYLPDQTLLKIDEQTKYMIEHEKKLKKVQQQQDFAKINNLLEQLRLKQQQQLELRQKLMHVTQQQLHLKNKQSEKARQIIERSKMSLQDKLSQLNQLFKNRNQKLQARNKKIEQLQNSRKQNKQKIKQKNQTRIQKLVYPPIQQELVKQQQSPSFAKRSPGFIKQKQTSNFEKQKVIANKQMTQLIQVLSNREIQEDSDELDDEDNIWPQKQQNLKFQLPAEKWHMQEQNKAVQNTDQKVEQNKEEQQVQLKIYPSDDEQIYDDEQTKKTVSQDQHWPIDPDLEEKIYSLQHKANQYMHRIKKKRKNTNQLNNQFDDYSNFQLEQNFQHSNNGESLIYKQQQQQEPQNFSQSSISSIPLRIQDTIKLPKGRANRKVIDLAPRK